MDSLFDRLFILILCIVTFVSCESIDIIIPRVLLAMILLCGLMLIERTAIKSGILIGVAILMVLYPTMFYFAPLFVYEIVKERKVVEGIVLWISVLYAGYVEWKLESFMMVVVVGILAIWMQQQNEKKNRYEEQLIQTRDQSVELTEALKKTNRALIEKQEYEVYAATLKERNRIAREIHDNVGHVLSRSILQVGALLAIYKEEEIHDRILEVKESLDSAMNRIRESVHNLHDASIDLKSGIAKAIEGMEGFEVFLHYDIGEDIDNETRHCILSVVQEAVSNIARHSNGTQVWIRVNEQPAFYQCAIKDNGTKNERKGTPGIGLENMKVRVENLNGHLNITNDDGFRIFVSIPKNKEMM